MKNLSTLLLILIFAVLSIGTVNAGLAFKRFRLGKILNAEVTSKSLSFKDVNAKTYPQKFNNRAFAALTVKFDPGRSISKHDFVLEADGKEYPCVAVRKDNGLEKWQFETTDKDSLYTIYFMVDAPGINSGSDLEYELKYKLNSSGSRNVNIKFKNRGNGDLTPPAQVSRDGMMACNRYNSAYLSA